MRRFLKPSKPVPKPKSRLMDTSPTPEPADDAPFNIIDLTSDDEDDSSSIPPIPDAEEYDNEGEDAVEQLTEEEFFRHIRHSRTAVPPGHDRADFATIEDGARIGPGDTVELHNGTFFKIEHIIRERALGYQPHAFKLRGILLKCCRHMDNMFEKNINELVAILLVPLRDSRPNFVTGMEEVSLSLVKRIREVIFTNAIFPAHSFRTVPCPENWSQMKRDNNGQLVLDKYDNPRWVYNSAVINEEARLVVRWASVRHFDKSDGKVKREVFRRLAPAEADPGYSVSRVQLLRTYQRGLMRRQRASSSAAMSTESSGPAPEPSRKRRSTITIDDSDDEVVVTKVQPTKKRKRTFTEESHEMTDVFAPEAKASGLPLSRVTKYHRTTYSEEVEAGPSTFSPPHQGPTPRGGLTRLYPPLQKKYAITDLYCGMGGVSEGARMAGLNVKYGVEREKHVAETHQLNHPTCRTLQMNVADFLQDREVLTVDVLHSSCPCRYWSMQHTVDGKNDEENIAASFMVAEAARKTQCRVMTFEQAPGLLWKRVNKPYWQLWINQFTSMGWDVEWRVLNFVNHRNPQGRKRLIVIAACPGQLLPEFPAETSGPGLRPFMTVNEAISNIKPDATNHNPQQMRQEQRMKPRNLPAADGNKVLQHIVDRAGPSALHPNGRRKFTIREVMRLQTFPDTYKMRIESRNGRTPWTKAVGMVGDAVPPVVMEAIFTNVIKALQKTDDEVSAFVVPAENAIEID
ncbi:uncharacterized protein MYCFIDRAFT_76598 [Pseudocercospora fijiensis CIRAD86]|uniref:DNA (cytosine-5-)-methyltransferase n=1 Tax=Pseudocercospora fijiensis (strain CIRAD86) TaxID=383855 RepID=N1QCQ8_PSEFD|nr:uncharacterized protein MYCFIDRAFT_76598 [Pseudocercospora fijiensis CIRAD86]EME89243.1 hypothetical protein MYCFIDRAFT_76598 [Pseudocercospora fijiensis CIRAD86]